MTSPDGITWTTRSTSGIDNEWYSVCWGAELGLFCAVGKSGTGNRVMTSPDGITWTTQTSASDNNWTDVCWSPELSLFCAVSATGTGNMVMTSPDGITWTTRTTATGTVSWWGVCWSAELGLFCATGQYTTSAVMTSPDGITWTTRTTPNKSWRHVAWAPELKLFTTITWDNTGYGAMTSPDGITWTSQTSTPNGWLGVCWSPELGIFCAVSYLGTGNRVMTSKKVLDIVNIKEQTVKLTISPTFSGPIAGVAVPITLRRTNNIVYYDFGGIDTTAQTTNAVLECPASTIPVEFRPLTYKYVYSALLDNTTDDLCFHTINTDGSIQLKPYSGLFSGSGNLAVTKASGFWMM
jgi:hypothetical protein